MASLRRQLEDHQLLLRGLRQSIIDDAADDAGARRELHRQHREALASARKKAKEDAAEEMAAAVAAAWTAAAATVAAARAEATAAERARLNAAVGPVLAALEAEQVRLQREAEAAKQRQAALEAELTDTRQLVFDALENPAEVFSRLGL